MSNTEKTYRTTVRTTEENKLYLQETAWINKISISEYIESLIEADKAAHPNWRETLDDLND